MVFLLVVAAMLAGATFAVAARYLLIAVLLAYGGVLAVEAVRIVRRLDGRALNVVAAFMALHFGYGLGMLEGVGRALREPAAATWRARFRSTSSEGVQGVR
jgi:hypothetical protein